MITRACDFCRAVTRAAQTQKAHVVELENRKNAATGTPLLPTTTGTHRDAPGPISNDLDQSPLRATTLSYHPALPLCVATARYHFALPLPRSHSNGCGLRISPQEYWISFESAANPGRRQGCVRFQQRHKKQPTHTTDKSFDIHVFMKKQSVGLGGKSKQSSQLQISLPTNMCRIGANTPTAEQRTCDLCKGTPTAS